MEPNVRYVERANVQTTVALGIFILRTLERCEPVMGIFQAAELEQRITIKIRGRDKVLLISASADAAHAERFGVATGCLAEARLCAWLSSRAQCTRLHEFLTRTLLSASVVNVQTMRA